MAIWYMYFMAMWYILWPIGIVFRHFGELYHENLATLVETAAPFSCPKLVDATIYSTWRRLWSGGSVTSNVS
jgi:hypothetical protein